LFLDYHINGENESLWRPIKSLKIMWKNKIWIRRI